MLRLVSFQMGQSLEYMLLFHQKAAVEIETPPICSPAYHNVDAIFDWIATVRRGNHLGLAQSRIEINYFCLSLC